MSISYLRRGVLVDIDARQYQLKRQLANNIWQIEAIQTGRIIEHTDKELREMYASRKLVFTYEASSPKLRSKQALALSARAIPVPENVSNESWEKAKIKRQYVLAVIDLPGTEKIMKLAIKQTANKLAVEGKEPHWTTVLRWKNKYLQQGKDIHALFDKQAEKGNRTRRYPKEVLRIVEDTIELHYLTLEKKTVANVVEHAILAVGVENQLRTDSEMLPLPTRRIVEKAISQVPAFDRCAAREGKTYATKKFRGVLNVNVTEYPLERAEIDHTLLDLFVVDDRSLLPLGRPWITACIDAHTRCILGIYIGFEPPSNLTVSRCLKHAFIPKTNLQDDWPTINNTWDAHGVMENLIVDNGLEFHSKALEKIALSFGINLHYSARKTPWYKGKIERFFGTLNREIAHPTPGTTFSNIFEKSEYDPSKHAVLSFSKLKEVIHKWVVDVYHQRPHRGLDNQTPSDVWSSSVLDENIPLPDDPEQLDAMMGATEVRMLSHKGIVVDGIWYSVPDLITIRRQLGDVLEVNVRIDEGDLGHIYMKIPKCQDFIKVKAINSHYAEGLTKFQHKIIKRFSAKNSYKRGIPGWLRAKGELHEIIQKSLYKRNAKSNARAARYSENQERVQEVLQNSEAPLNLVDEVNSECEDRVSTLHMESKRPSFEVIIEERNKKKKEY